MTSFVVQSRTRTGLRVSHRLQQLERIEKADCPEDLPRALVTPHFEFRQNVHGLRERLKTSSQT